MSKCWNCFAGRSGSCCDSEPLESKISVEPYQKLKSIIKEIIHMRNTMHCSYNETEHIEEALKLLLAHNITINEGNK